MKSQLRPGLKHVKEEKIIIAVPCSKLGVEVYHGKNKSPEKYRNKPIRVK